LESIFVYGTLRPPRPGRPGDDSFFYHRIAPYVRSAIPARLPGADLYDLGAYPAARPGQAVLHGDLLRIQPAALPLMDRIEGHPDLFRRERVTVRTGAGPAAAWIYWARPEMVAGKPLIPGGDWLAR
jgi:gamma-glutamylcyclotransferase (GGCT)/AIG2-like uncharacterized protein YtfP